MFQSTYTASTRWTWGRCGWVWRLHSRAACPKCARAVVLAGASSCPRCGSAVFYVAEMPRAGSAKFRRLAARYWHPAPAPDYPPAVPRRLPGCRLR